MLKILLHELVQFPSKVWKSYRTLDQGLTALNGTRTERRIRRKVRRWCGQGSGIFYCDPRYLHRLWRVTVDSPATMEDIVKDAEQLGELTRVLENLSKEKEQEKEE